MRIVYPAQLKDLLNVKTANSSILPSLRRVVLKVQKSHLLHRRKARKRIFFWTLEITKRNESFITCRSKSSSIPGCHTCQLIKKCRYTSSSRSVRNHSSFSGCSSENCASGRSSFSWVGKVISTSANSLLGSSKSAMIVLCLCKISSVSASVSG